MAQRDPGTAAGRLTARPGMPAGMAPTGLRPLRLARDGLLHVPSGYRVERPAPLLVLLHGAGGEAEQLLGPFEATAERHGILLLAPDSRGRTWDVILDGFGPDIGFLDRALAQTFAHYAVDPMHVAVGGFSDGASYALSLGLGNGGLFRHVLAFSPGFVAAEQVEGRPRLFVTHGIRDEVLPIGRTSRVLVPRLREAGYDVAYREFPGGHLVPPDLVEAGIEWLLRPG